MCTRLGRKEGGEKPAGYESLRMITQVPSVAQDLFQGLCTKSIHLILGAALEGVYDSSPPLLDEVTGVVKDKLRHITNFKFTCRKLDLSGAASNTEERKGTKKLYKRKDCYKHGVQE